MFCLFDTIHQVLIRLWFILLEIRRFYVLLFYLNY